MELSFTKDSSSHSRYRIGVKIASQNLSHKIAGKTDKAVDRIASKLERFFISLIRSVEYKAPKDAPEKIEEVEVVRREGNLVRIIGTSIKNRRYFVYHIIHESPSYRTVSDEVYKMGWYDYYSDWRMNSHFLREINILKQQNFREEFDKRNIKTYQCSISDLSEQLGRPLKIIETKSGETFIVSNNQHNLELAAFCLGANAITNYKENRVVLNLEVMGTPVRFADEPVKKYES